MISEKTTLGALTACVLAFLLLLAAAGPAWSASYLFSNEITEGEIFDILINPVDIDIGPDGKMFIADESNKRVIQLDEFGNFLWQCRFPGNFLPLAISADNTGNFYYVAKWNGVNSEVVKLPATTDCTPAYTLSWQFDAPSGIDVAADGSVYIADTNNDSIVKFNGSGGFVDEWVFFRDDVDIFHAPMDVAIYSDNIIIVLDTNANRVIGFNADGKYLAEVGVAGTGQLEFANPSGLAVGPDRGIYVSDTDNNRIQKFFVKTRTVAEIFGLDTALSLPSGLSVDKGGNVSVADFFNDRIAVFTPDIIELDDGAADKVVNIPGQISIPVDIQPDDYWAGVPSEVFAWAEGASGLIAYLKVFPPTGVGSNYGITRDITLMTPLPELTVDSFIWDVLNAPGEGLAGTWKLSVCYDREINGTFNPSSSVCDSIIVKIQ